MCMHHGHAIDNCVLCDDYRSPTSPNKSHFFSTCLAMEGNLSFTFASYSLKIKLFSHKKLIFSPLVGWGTSPLPHPPPMLAKAAFTASRKRNPGYTPDKINLVHVWQLSFLLFRQRPTPPWRSVLRKRRVFTSRSRRQTNGLITSESTWRCWGRSWRF